MSEKTGLKSYKDLIVYQKAKLLTINIIYYFSRYRLPYTQEFAVKQLLRASASVGANIAEGYGRFYRKSYRQFLSIARGSCFETDYWFEIVKEFNKFDNNKINSFSKVNVEIAKMLTAMMKKLES